MYYVYLIQSKSDFSTYIGYTSELKDRLKEHNQGKVRSTKSKIPYILIYYESYINKTDARKREIQLKKNSWEKERLFKQLDNSFMAPSSSG